MCLSMRKSRIVRFTLLTIIIATLLINAGIQPTLANPAHIVQTVAGPNEEMYGIGYNDSDIFFLGNGLFKYDKTGSFLDNCNAYAFGMANNGTHIFFGGLGTVTIVDSDLDQVDILGSYGSGDGQLDNAMDIAVNETHIFVADAGNNRISIFDLAGNFVSNFGSSGTGDYNFNWPAGIAVNDEFIIVVDQGNDRIQIFDHAGNFIRSIGSPGSEEGQFDSPFGIDADDKYIFIADTGNNRVQIFDLEGNFLLAFGGSAAEDGSYTTLFDVVYNGSHVFTLNNIVSASSEMILWELDFYYITETTTETTVEDHTTTETDTETETETNTETETEVVTETDTDVITDYNTSYITTMEQNNITVTQVEIIQNNSTITLSDVNPAPFAFVGSILGLGCIVAVFMIRRDYY